MATYIRQPLIGYTRLLYHFVATIHACHPLPLVVMFFLKIQTNQVVVAVTEGTDS